MSHEVMKQTSFKIFHTHGISPADVAVIERHFGERFPPGVDGPDAALLWVIAALPWERLVPVLRSCVERAFKKVGLSASEDYQVARTLELLVAKPDHKATTQHGTMLNKLIAARARTRGFGQVHPKIHGLDLDIRAWAAAASAVTAAHASVCSCNGPFNPRVAAYTTCLSAKHTIDWMISQTPEAEDLSTDRILQELVGALVAFMGTWTLKGARA